jgi:hypothetical protein
MDETNVRARLERHWEYAATDQDIAHEIYHDDAVLEFPQSGERFVGLENFRGWRRRYPAALDFRIRRIRGRDDLWVAENSISYDHGRWQCTVSILEFRGDKVARESIYISESWDPPAWRAPWRSEPDEQSTMGTSRAGVVNAVASPMVPGGARVRSRGGT